MKIRSGAFLRLCVRAAVWAMFAGILCHAVPAPAGENEPLRAFLLKDPPSDYGKIVKLFDAYQAAGANAVIVGPLGAEGPLTRKTLKNVIYLAHQMNLRLFVIARTRRNAQILRAHPDWEDRRYDPKRGSLRDTGLLDLFQRDVQRSVVNAIGSIASFSPDGILLADDLLYEETEGLGRAALAAYRARYNTDLHPKTVFQKRSGKNNSIGEDETNAEYGNFLHMKQEMLVAVVRKIIAATRSSGKSIVVGLPLRYYGYHNLLAVLPRYTQEIRNLKQAEADFYWITLSRIDDTDSDYRGEMEAVARTATIISEAASEGEKVMIVLPLTSISGRPLASTEIEEMTEMARKGGKSFVAYEVRSTTPLSDPLMNKLFRGP